MKKIKKSLSLFIVALFVMVGILGTITAKSASNVAVVVFPTINNIVREHTPLVAGDTEKFKVTSNYEGQVQYKALLFDGTVWSELSTAYGVAVDAKTPFVLPQTKQFKAGKYRLSVWVKRAGTVGSKKMQAVLVAMIITL